MNHDANPAAAIQQEPPATPPSHTGITASPGAALLPSKVDDGVDVSLPVVPFARRLPVLGIGILASAVFIWAFGVCAAVFAMRVAVGRYDRDDAVVGLSPANLTYSLQSGYWIAGMGVAALLLSYFACVSMRIRGEVSMSLSIAVALVTVVAITFVNWLSWIL